jgi:hypothetical protein
MPAHHVRAVRDGDVAELRDALQKAIELEHATIPTYLYSLFSVHVGTNSEAAGILRSVVIEEMLHMAIAANVLNAIGGTPILDKPAFIPTYPGPLPLDIDGVVVHLRKLSKEQVQETFRAIEMPGDPRDIPVEKRAAFAAFAATSLGDESYATIGDFYQTIIEKICEFGPRIFTGDPARQVTSELWFSEQLTAVVDPDAACRQLKLIVSQGEGPLGGQIPVEQGRAAHYYRFGEIVYGGRLVVKDDGTYAYDTSKPVPLDMDRVHDVIEDAKLSDYPEGSTVRQLAEECNLAYSNLLRALHQAFNGDPAKLNAAVGLMYELRLLCSRLVQMEVPGRAGKRAAPPFSYMSNDA